MYHSGYSSPIAAVIHSAKGRSSNAGYPGTSKTVERLDEGGSKNSKGQSSGWTARCPRKRAITSGRQGFVGMTSSPRQSADKA